MRQRWRNRRGAPVLAVVTWLYILWSLVPVLVAARISLNDGKSRSSFQPMSWRWYWGDPNASLLHDDSLHTAMINTLELAGMTILFATPLGVAMAIGLHRWRGRTSSAANGLMLVPIVRTNSPMRAFHEPEVTAWLRVLGVPAENAVRAVGGGSPPGRDTLATDAEPGPTARVARRRARERECRPEQRATAMVTME